MNDSVQGSSGLWSSGGWAALIRLSSAPVTLAPARATGATGAGTTGGTSVGAMFAMFSTTTRSLARVRHVEPPPLRCAERDPRRRAERLALVAALHG